jgi:thioredoxin reductase (NADPH)
VPRRPEVPEIERFEGAGVFYSVRRVSDFAGRKVLIVGGGNAAFDWALMLEPVTGKITHIHRNDFFSAHEDSVRRVSRSSVEMLFPFWELAEVAGEDRVREATIVQSRTGERRHLEVDAVIINIGFSTDPGPLSGWGLKLNKNAIVVDGRMRSSLEGVYAAGDIADYDGKLKLISTGFGEVAIAVNNAKNYINPRARVSPGHSTDRHEAVQRKLARMKERQSG